MVIGETKVNNCVDALVDAMKSSTVYQRYIQQRELVSEHTGLQQQIDQYRRRNFEIQQSYQGDELATQLDNFMNQNAEFRDNPLVDNYLDAELAFCRMIQDIDSRILDDLDFH